MMRRKHPPKQNFRHNSFRPVIFQLYCSFNSDSRDVAQPGSALRWG